MALGFVTEELCRQLKIDESEAEALLGAFEVLPFEYKGEVIGAAVFAGTEAHFLVNPARKGRCGIRREINRLFKLMLDRNGYLTTRIPVGTPEKDRTGARLGFTWTWSDGVFDYYIATELPYAHV